VQSVTPAVDIPVRAWITIMIGIVRKYFSGMVVNGHKAVVSMNKGPATFNTDLLEKRSAKLPRKRRNSIFITWLNTGFCLL
jgi:hypothetical protein